MKKSYYNVRNKQGQWTKPEPEPLVIFGKVAVYSLIIFAIVYGITYISSVYAK